MQTFVQEEWHGMVRRGRRRADPFTSYVEVNTEPGSDELRKITSRQPYVSNPVPAPAFRFEKFGSRWTWMRDTGAYIAHSFSATDFEACVCCRWAGKAEFPTGKNPTVFGVYGTAGPAWCIRPVRSGSDWVWQFYVQTSGGSDNITASNAIDPDVWYWIWVETVTDTIYMKIYKDGSGSEDEDLNKSVTKGTFTCTDARACVGGNDHDFYATFWKGEVAYAAYGDDTGSNVPTPPAWRAQISGDAIVAGFHADCAFKPVDPRWSIQPAAAPYTTQTRSWVYWPRPGMVLKAKTESGDSYHFDCKGPWTYRGGSTVLKLGRTLFKKRTVLMFLCDISSTPGYTILARCLDDSFMITFATDTLTVIWTPTDASLGLTTDGGKATATCTSSFSLPETNMWVAVEVIPSAASGATNLNIYHYTAGSWTNINHASAVVIGGGVESTASTDWVLGESMDGSFTLYDFRIIEGDDSWTTNHTPTSITQSVPSQLITWLNHSTTDRFPRDENISTVSLANNADLVAPVVALSDRVDGVKRYVRNYYETQLSWSGCEHLLNSYRATPQELLADSDGVLSGPTDAFYLENDDEAVPQLAAQTKGRLRAAPVGTHRYVTGPAPLQRVTSNISPVGFFGPYGKIFTPTDAATSTLDDMGELLYATDYKMASTLYDPLTGDESNPWCYGRFTTDSNPGTSAGCAYEVGASITSRINTFGHLQVRFYRYHDTNEKYYLDGATNLSSLGAGTGWVFTSRYRFTLSDDYLATQPELEVDNDSPPDHAASVIWGGRAFYVDAVNPSRVYFSKLYQVGAVPLTNVIWTDEGLTGNILGFLPGFGGLLLLRENSIWHVPQFLDSTTAFATVLIPEAGCVSSSAALFVADVLWFLSPKGLYSFGNGQLINHSVSLENIDRSVWDNNIRETTAYYRTGPAKVVFVCMGTGLSIDVQTGAVALCSAPETCIVEMATESYSGTVFGATGQLWKEVSGNKSLSLDTGGAMSTNNLGLTTLQTLTYLYFTWTDGIENTGTVPIGMYSTSTSIADATYGWLASGSIVGKTLSLYQNTSYDDICSLAIEGVEQNDIMYCKHANAFSTSIFSHWAIEQVPWAYQSQDAWLGHKKDPKIYDSMDVTTGDIGGSATVDLVASSRLQGAAATETSGTAVWGTNNSYQLAVRTRGNRFHYLVKGCDANDTPNIRSIRTHFVPLRPRGRP